MSTVPAPPDATPPEPTDLEITPDLAGWGYSSLRVIALAAGERRIGSSGDEEIIVLPLSGALRVTTEDEELHAGRPDRRVRRTDRHRVPAGRTPRSTCVQRRRRPVRPLRRADASAAARSATCRPPRCRSSCAAPGQCSRQVRNFGTPDALPPAAIIACEVITPAGTGRPTRRTSTTSRRETESELEEIYYFEIAPGPNGEPGLGFIRTSSSPGHEIDICEEVHDRDTVLVPYGWHGPAWPRPATTCTT